MSASNPSDAFECWAKIIHNPPAPPQLAPGAFGIIGVESVFGPGGYLLTLHPGIEKDNVDFDGSFVATPPGGFGLMMPGEVTPPDPHKIFFYRFEAYPANAGTDGPFTVKGVKVAV